MTCHTSISDCCQLDADECGLAVLALPFSRIPSRLGPCFYSSISPSFYPSSPPVLHPSILLSSLYPFISRSLPASPSLPIAALIHPSFHPRLPSLLADLFGRSAVQNGSPSRLGSDVEARRVTPRQELTAAHPTRKPIAAVEHSEHKQMFVAGQSNSPNSAQGSAETLFAHCMQDVKQRKARRSPCGAFFSEIQHAAC